MRFVLKADKLSAASVLMTAELMYRLFPVRKSTLVANDVLGNAYWFRTAYWVSDLERIV
jgi:hypothetical protein